MMVGFDLDSPLVCEGIVGDGCGGGRIFYIDSNILKVYDPITNDNMVLIKDLKNPKKLIKKGCIISIIYEQEIVEFDLSLIFN